MNSITPDTIVTKKDDIFAGVVDNEMVAMSIENGKYYQMNETGARIFALLDHPRTVRELCEELEGKYRVESGVLRQDILEYLQDMAGLGLISAE